MILQHLWEEAQAENAAVQAFDDLNESAIAHGNALCQLVEMDSSCDDAEIIKASDILDQVGKALDMTNDLSDDEARNKHVERINNLLASVRDIIKGLVDNAKAKQEENELDLDASIDALLSDLEMQVDGEGGVEMEPTGVDDMSGNVGMEPTGDDGMGDDMGGEEAPMGDDVPSEEAMGMENEECARHAAKVAMNHRSKVRRMEGQKCSFNQYLVLESREE